MLIELPRSFERFGNAMIFDTQKIYGFDSSPLPARRAIDRYFVIKSIDYDSLRSVEENMAIVVPIKNERLKLLEGVMCGLPQHVLPIIISNSSKEPINRYQMEFNTIDNFCQFSKRPFLMVHQQDPELGKLFKAIGYDSILAEHGGLKSGKAEGMIAGTLLAWLTNKKHIGFIDSDNYFPGAVFEYVRNYSAAINLSKSQYHMVRILWHSKPKAIDSRIFFSRYGRSSKHTNQILNRLISLSIGFESEIIRTGNAGEHAMSMNLAMNLDYASDYAVETYHFINIFEKFGGVSFPGLIGKNLDEPIEIFQVESRNPHLHESKGNEHVKDMIHQSMSVIYHSPIAGNDLKEEIAHLLRRERILKRDEIPQIVNKYPALSSFDLDKATAAFNPDYFLFSSGR